MHSSDETWNKSPSWRCKTIHNTHGEVFRCRITSNSVNLAFLILAWIVQYHLKSWLLNTSLIRQRIYNFLAIEVFTTQVFDHLSYVRSVSLINISEHFSLGSLMVMSATLTRPPTYCMISPLDCFEYPSCLLPWLNECLKIRCC